MLLGSLLLLVAFYKELLLSSFDPGLASCLGIRVRWIHHGLMLWLSMVVVASFEAVGGDSGDRAAHLAWSHGLASHGSDGAPIALERGACSPEFCQRDAFVGGPGLFTGRSRSRGWGRMVWGCLDFQPDRRPAPALASEAKQQGGQG